MKDDEKIFLSAELTSGIQRGQNSREFLGVFLGFFSGKTVPPNTIGYRPNTHQPGEPQLNNFTAFSVKWEYLNSLRIFQIEAFTQAEFENNWDIEAVQGEDTSHPIHFHSFSGKHLRYIISLLAAHSNDFWRAWFCDRMFLLTWRHFFHIFLNIGMPWNLISLRPDTNSNRLSLVQGVPVGRLPLPLTTGSPRTGLLIKLRKAKCTKFSWLSCEHDKFDFSWTRPLEDFRGTVIGWDRDQAWYISIHEHVSLRPTFHFSRHWDIWGCFLILGFDSL